MEGSFIMNSVDTDMLSVHGNRDPEPPEVSASDSQYKRNEDDRNGIFCEHHRKRAGSSVPDLRRFPCDRRFVYVRVPAGEKTRRRTCGSGMDPGIPYRFSVPQTVFPYFLRMYDAVPHAVLQTDLGKPSGKRAGNMGFS